MAFLIQSEGIDKETGEIAPIYAKSVGKTNVVWTHDRDEARRYKKWETVAKAAQRVSRANAKDGRASRAFPAPDPAP